MTDTERIPTYDGLKEIYKSGKLERPIDNVLYYRNKENGNIGWIKWDLFTMDTSSMDIRMGTKLMGY